MSAADNKQTIQTMYAELAKGKLWKYLAPLADDVRLTIIGSTAGSQSGVRDLAVGGGISKLSALSGQLSAQTKVTEKRKRQRHLLVLPLAYHASRIIRKSLMAGLVNDGESDAIK